MFWNMLLKINTFIFTGEKTMDRIAVLIPCYNEEKTIHKVIHDFKKALPESVIYVYDNNSTDRTALTAELAGAIVKHEYRQGKGNVIRRMFREIDAECYLMVDGDDTYSAESAPKMVEQITKKHIDMVIGDRLSSTYFSENKRRFHNTGNALVRKLINILFHSDIQDIMTGYRAFSYHFVKTFPVLSKGFEIETEMTIHAVDKNLSIANVIIDYRDRPQGSVSKLNTFSDGFKVIKTIAQLFKHYKPDVFFGLSALVLEAIAIMLFVPILVKYCYLHSVPNFPTLIVACFIAMAGIQSFFSGLILSSVAEKNKRDFEIQLMKVDRDFKNMRNENDNARKFI